MPSTPHPISPDTLATLKTRCRGPVLLPSDPGFEDARTVWNAMIDRHPPAVVRCLGAADVIEAVKVARAAGLSVTIKGGGHNIAGLAVADDTLMLDLSLMRGVVVDPERRIASAQGGCLLGDVDRETQLRGLAAVLGFVSNTGIAGLTLGGGFGYLSRRHGWTCDNVQSIELVTADGQLTRASEDENPDLFWGLRGGGGNFGIATRFDYNLYQLGPEIVGGPIAWSADEAPEVLDLYRSMAAEAPRELTLVAVIRKAPPAPWLQADIHGKLIIIVMACYAGDPADGEEIVKPLKAFGSPVGDVLQRRPYITQQSLLDATQPKGRRYYWKSEYLPSVEPGLIEQYLRFADNLPSPHCGIIIFPIGGALNETPTDLSPVGNRDAQYVLNVAAAWDTPAEDDANISWARDAWAAMREYSTGGTYVNFLTEEEGEDRTLQAYGSHHARLKQIKAAWDPDNFFRANKNITPG